MTTTRRQRASAHARHGHYCSCGKVVFGNGGKASHEAMHVRRRDWKHGPQGAFATGFHWLTHTAWLGKFGSGAIENARGG